MELKRVILDNDGINRAIARISYEILEHNKGTDNICLIGMYTRGVDIANRIARKIFEIEGRLLPIGNLDITNFRDDKKEEIAIDKSKIPFDIDDKKIILVDDVIFTGRSVRAAIDAIMQLGRPQKIELAVLIDRGHRELPIRADFVGKNLPTARTEKIKVKFKETDGEDQVLIIKEEV